MCGNIIMLLNILYYGYPGRCTLKLCNQLNVRTVLPHLSGCVAIVAETEHVLSGLEAARNLHLVEDSRLPTCLIGGGKELLPQAWCGGLSQREQSLPSVSGQGRQAPAEQLPGLEQPFFSSPFLQPQS